MDARKLSSCSPLGAVTAPSGDTAAAPAVNIDAIGPLFSVVIPSRNRGRQLAAAIESVVRQTLRSWELIVVDDASDEAAVVPDDPRIHMVRLPSHTGKAGARNAGVAAARGRYIAFLDDDDLFTEDRLEIALEGLSEAPVTTCWMRYIDGPADPGVILDGDVSNSILDHPTPSLGVTALLRSTFVPFDSRWGSVEDVDWWLRVAASSPVATVRRIGYLFGREHDLSDPARRAEIERRVAENLELLNVYSAYFRRHRRAAAFRLKRVGLMSLDLGDRRRARSTFVRSLLRLPAASTAWHLIRATAPALRKRPSET